MKENQKRYSKVKRTVVCLTIVILLGVVANFIFQEAKHGTFGPNIRVKAGEIAVRLEDAFFKKEPLNFDQEAYAGDSAMLVYDTLSDRIIYANRDKESFAPASLTKLITAIVVLEELSGDDVVHVTNDVLSLVKEGSSKSNISPGDYRVQELINAMLIASGNDAAYALALGAAEKINGHELTATEGLNLFVNRMNEWLRNNQYTDTIVTDPAGNADGDRSTLNDLLGITLQSLKIAEIDNAVRQKEALIHSVEGNVIQVKTTNFLMDPNDLNYNPRVTGVKTGTLEGLANIIIRYERKGYEYICIILGETTSKEREMGALSFTYAADHVPGSGGFDSIVDKLQSLGRIFSGR